MARNKPTPNKRNWRQDRDAQILYEPEDRPIKRMRPPPIKAQTENQQRYINAIKTFTVTLAVGPAGTGKTYICASLAAEALEAKTVDRIIVTRPAVEAGESLGFLPGEIEEKFDPYMAPFREVLEERLGKTMVEYEIKRERIEAAPLAYMRGRTFKNAFVILDEAQNTTPAQMKMFLTRIGENCTVVVNGDMAQHDVNGESGLQHAVKVLGRVPSIKIIEFTRQDCVRSGIVGEILDAYEGY